MQSAYPVNTYFRVRVRGSENSENIPSKERKAPEGRGVVFVEKGVVIVEIGGSNC